HLSLLDEVQQLIQCFCFLGHRRSSGQGQDAEQANRGGFYTVNAHYLASGAGTGMFIKSIEASLRAMRRPFMMALRYSPRFRETHVRALWSQAPDTSVSVVWYSRATRPTRRKFTSRS